MTSHPARSQKSHDAAIRRLLNKFSLQTVSVTFTPEVVVMRASPQSWNPVVKARVEALLEPGRDYSLSEMGRLREGTMAPIAHVSGKTMDETFPKLVEALAAASPA